MWCSAQDMSAALELSVSTVDGLSPNRAGVPDPPRRRQTRARSSFDDRVHIEIEPKPKRSRRSIANDLFRAPSTIRLLLNHYTDARRQYSAKQTHGITFTESRRSHASMIESTPSLQTQFLSDLPTWYSPEGSRVYCVVTSPSIRR